MNSLVARWMGAAWVALALVGPALAGDIVTLEPGMDRLGADYKNFPVRLADPAVCRQACAADAACKAYTFVKPGIKGPAAVCFLKSSAAPSAANACCTSGMKTPAPIAPVPGVQPQGPIQIAANPAPIIAAPTNAKVELDPDQNGLSWSWGGQGCFPGAAGKAPIECQYIKDIDGYKIFDGAGKLFKTVSNPATKSVAIGKGSSGCYVVRAYKGALESAKSEPACVEGSSKPKYQVSDSIAAPVSLHASASAAECAAATPGVMTAAACDVAIKSNYQPLVWTWTGNQGAIDGFRLYDRYNGQPVEMAVKSNAALRMFIIAPLNGVKIDAWCFSVRAFKGNAESQSSNEVCLQALAPVPPPLPPAPAGLHLTKSVSECASAAGNPLLAFLCDAAIKANGQVLAFDWKGGPNVEIDGYRLYDNVSGKRLLHETKYHRDQRMFVIPALSGEKLSDFCFQVRAFSGERESLPSNTVCVAPLAPVPPPPGSKYLTVLQPIGGILVNEVDWHKDFNSGCPFTEHMTKIRTRDPFAGTIQAMYMHIDKNILCGKRILVWNEGSVEFAMSAVPAKFYKATLKFISNGTVAKVGTEGGFLNVFGNPVTVNSVNCISALTAYNTGGLDNSESAIASEKLGNPLAWFSFDNTATIANATNTAQEGGNAFDVTAVLRQSVKTKQKKQGFNFAVNRAMVGDNDMCVAGFKAFTLEFE